MRLFFDLFIRDPFFLPNDTASTAQVESFSAPAWSQHPYKGEDWQLIRINPSQEEILQELDLLPRPETPPKKKPGRPKGSKKKEETPTEEPTKKKRGRPKGSKNKPKDQPADVMESTVDS